MADYSALYVLTTPGGTIRLNNGILGGTSKTNLYWISTITGLDGAPIRTTIDDAPQAHGGLVHKAWKGPRHVGFEGAIIIQQVPFGHPCQQYLNPMEDALKAAWESIFQADGTLAWTPAGGTPKTLTVRADVPVDIQPLENYMLRQFTFGIVAANPDF